MSPYRLNRNKTNRKQIACIFSDGSGTRNSGFRFWKWGGEMGLRQVEQGFSSFFAKFLVYLMISQSITELLVRYTLKNEKYAKKLAKKK